MVAIFLMIIEQLIRNLNSDLGETTNDCCYLGAKKGVDMGNLKNVGYT